MQSDAASPPSDQGRYLLATVTVCGHALKHLYAAAFMIVLPEIKGGLGLSNLAAGALVTSRDVSAGVSTMPAGFLADRFSSKWAIILTISMALLAIGYLAAGTLESYWAVAVSIVLFGIGVSLWHPSALASLSARFPTRRGLAISLHGSGGSAGEIIGPLLAGGLLVVIAWPLLLQFSFIPAALAAVLVWFALRNLKGQQGVSSIREYFSASGDLMRNKAFIAVVTLSGFRSLSNHVVTTFVPIYLREDLEFSTFEVGLYASLLQVIGIGTHPIMGWISDRFGRKVALVPGMIVFGLLCIALGLRLRGPAAAADHHRHRRCDVHLPPHIRSLRHRPVAAGGARDLGGAGLHGLDAVRRGGCGGRGLHGRRDLPPLDLHLRRHCGDCGGAAAYPGPDQAPPRPGNVAHRGAGGLVC